MNKLAFKVKKAAEKKIHQGHPWVYESSIIKQNKEGKPGDQAIIFDQRKNQFLAVGLYDPNSVIRIKILHHGKPIPINAQFFKNKINLAYAKRKALLRTETDAYRLIYGENDGFPGLVIDIYNQNAVLKLYSAIWFPYLDLLKNILIDSFMIEVIVLRLNRILQASNTTHEDGTVIHGTLDNEEIIFKEHGLKFKANLIKGHKTGYFLDHRHNRLAIRKYSKNKTVLDVFSFAGGFSVNALAGGASHVVSLDISKQALQIAQANVRLNFNTTKHDILATDAFKGIEELKNEGRMFDLIIIDPPSFAKSQDQIEKAKKSYERLVKTGLTILNKNGILLMASCSSRIDKEVFFKLVINALEKSRRTYEIIDKSGHDVDHPEGIKELSYLKAIYLSIS